MSGAKVREVKVVSTARDQYVVELNVAMNNVNLFEALKRCCHLPQYPLDKSLVQRKALLLCEEVHQATLGHVLHDDAVLICALKGLVGLDEARAAQLRESLHQAWLDTGFRARELGNGYGLDCVLLLRVLVASQTDGAKAALPHHLEQLVRIQPALQVALAVEDELLPVPNGTLILEVDFPDAVSCLDNAQTEGGFRWNLACLSAASCGLSEDLDRSDFVRELGCLRSRDPLDVERAACKPDVEALHRSASPRDQAGRMSCISSLWFCMQNWSFGCLFCDLAVIVWHLLTVRE